jgi:hypothetical protein
MANGTIAFDTLSTSGQIDGTAKSVDTDYVVNGAVKSWARINGTGSGVPANQSFNVGSTTDSGTGDYEVAYSNNFSDGEYCITLGDSNNADVASATHTRCNTSSASGLGLQVYYNGALADATNVFYQVTGDLA